MLIGIPYQDGKSLQQLYITKIYLQYLKLLFLFCLAFFFNF